MPLYEYKCHECNERFERIEKASSPSDGVCPSCGGAARRLLGAPALQFKGSGWYVTDYGKDNGSSAATKTEANTEPKSEKTTTDTPSKETDAPTKSTAKVA